MSPNQLRDIATEFVVRQRGQYDLRRPDQARDKCAMASNDLAEHYANGAKRIRLHGHRCPARLDDPRPGGGAGGVHYAVLVEGVIVDVTRRQFDRSAKVPTIYDTLDEVGRDWCGWSPDDEWDNIRPLPAPR